MLKRGPPSGDTETGKVEVIWQGTHFIEDQNTQTSPTERTEAEQQQASRWAQAHDTYNPTKHKSKKRKNKSKTVRVIQNGKGNPNTQDDDLT